MQGGAAPPGGSEAKEDGAGPPATAVTMETAEREENAREENKSKPAWSPGTGSQSQLRSASRPGTLLRSLDGIRRLSGRFGGKKI